ncbi:MAG: YhbY family RNA-binding protein [Clostridiales bacterium]|nr:YhbY family RNA-binding protein [Clostridiales bacterium]
MELTGKQRAHLRALANGLDTILYLGKDGITDSVLREADELLTKRELIKCAVQQNAPLSAKEASIEICHRTGASPVQTIGRRFTIFRRNEEEPVIDLP